MVDVIQTIKANTKKLLKMGADELNDKIHFYRETEKLEEEAFKPDANGYKPGDTVAIKIPPHWTVQEDSFDITGLMQDALEQSVNMSLDMSGTIPFDLDTNQLATDIDLKSAYERLIQPAILDLAANMESRFIKKATQYVGNLVGTAGTTIVDPNTVMEGGEKLDEFLAPIDNRNFLMDSAAMRSAVNANKNLFTFSKEERNKASLGEAYGMEWLKNQLIYRHTNGNDVSCAVEADVVTPAQGMTTLGVDGLTTTTGTLTKGTVFTIDNVYAVHPQTKQTLTFLKQFTHVGADLTANGSGQVTVNLNEPIYSTGSRKNVDALPADEATINIVGSASATYKQSLIWHKKAFRVCTVPLQMPKGSSVELAEQVNEGGINIGLIRFFDGNTRKWITRLDCLGGLVAVRPIHGCRVTA